MSKQGRNEPCPCGSGKKYKKCCLAKEAAPLSSLTRQKMRKTEGELIHSLLKHVDKYYSEAAVGEAWEEFTVWGDLPMDLDTQPELETAFLPWFVFNWIPDNAEIDEAEHFPEMQVAKHYLEQKRSQLDSFQRRFIEEICSQPYSFFLVMEVEPGKSLSLRDLFLEREVTVHELQASTIVKKGSIIFTRIMTLDDCSIMVGCAPKIIPPSYLNEFIDVRATMEKKLPEYDQHYLLEYSIELRDIYYSIREELQNPSLPELQNTDGDAIELTKLFYKLACKPAAAVEALATLSMVSSVDDLISMGEFDENGELQSIDFPWLKKGNKHHASWQNTAMGDISIKGDKLTVSVNSRERAEAIKRKIERRLGKRAKFSNAVIESSERMFDEVARQQNSGLESASQESEALQALPEVQAQLKEMSEQHWNAWLDSAIPALKDQTPREAAKTKIGRQRLEALLIDFEYQNTLQPAQPFAPDVDALRKALGLN